MEVLNQIKGRRIAGTSVIYRLTDPALAAGATLQIPAIDVNSWDSARGRISADQACTVSVYYGSDGNEDTTPTTTDISAGECIPLTFDALEETLRIEVENTSGSDMTALTLTIRARS